jgi:hypothetical protein
VPIIYAGHAETWDELTIDGEIASKDCLLRFRRKGRTLPVASIFRDAENLQAKVTMERTRRLRRATRQPLLSNLNRERP